MNAVRVALRAYERATTVRPLLVQSSMAGAIASLGDLLMQRIERRETIDAERTGRIALFRLTIFGPLYSLWMRNLERLVVVSSPARAVVAKTALDQLVWTPPSLSSFYIFSMLLLAGLEPSTSYSTKLQLTRSDPTAAHSGQARGPRARRWRRARQAHAVAHAAGQLAVLVGRAYADFHRGATGSPDSVGFNGASGLERLCVRPQRAGAVHHSGT